jgi:MOSC domain-containing protein YiiM
MGIPIHAVLTGRVSPLGRHGVPSGIFKGPLAEPVLVTRAGLAGDERGDRKHHGGPEKAVHHYPWDHYAGWRAEVPELTQHLEGPGAFGENLSTTGLTEAQVFIGDIYRLGTARVEVSQGRQPCWRLNERFGLDDMARRVQESGRTGWYYRVLEEGRVGPGDELELLHRPAGSWPLSRALHVLYWDPLNRDELGQLAKLPGLSESWRALARRRLEDGVVEDWSRRLEGGTGQGRL